MNDKNSMTPQQIIEAAQRQKDMCSMVSEDLGIRAYWMTILTLMRETETP